MDNIKELIQQDFDQLSFADQIVAGDMLATFLGCPQETRELILEKKDAYIKLFIDYAKDIKFFELEQND